MTELDSLPADAVTTAEKPVIDFGIEKNFAFKEFCSGIINAGNTYGVIEQ
jgi:hypothetical protein